MDSSLHPGPCPRHDFFTRENTGNTGGNLVTSSLDFLKMGAPDKRINVGLYALDKFLSQIRPMGWWKEKGFLKKLIHRCRHGQTLHHVQNPGNSRGRHVFSGR